MNRVADRGMTPRRLAGVGLAFSPQPLAWPVDGTRSRALVYPAADGEREGRYDAGARAGDACSLDDSCARSSVRAHATKLAYAEVRSTREATGQLATDQKAAGELATGKLDRGKRLLGSGISCTRQSISAVSTKCVPSPALAGEGQVGGLLKRGPGKRRLVNWPLVSWPEAAAGD
jgi:hypothetical protein